jgi:hypothetical protein
MITFVSLILWKAWSNVSLVMLYLCHAQSHQHALKTNLIISLGMQNDIYNEGISF